MEGAFWLFGWRGIIKREPCMCKFVSVSIYFYENTVDLLKFYWKANFIQTKKVGLYFDLHSDRDYVNNYIYLF